jgi:hypothetical protein
MRGREELDYPYAGWTEKSLSELEVLERLS